VPEHPAPSSLAPAALTGRLLADRYRLGHRIASGGMATVFRAVDETLHREVAVKVLHPHLSADGAVVERFRREAVAAARLTHPSIVGVYDTVSDAGLEAIVMELVDGITLREFLDQRGRLSPRDAVDIAAGVAEALVVAHEAGVVHRDVKPANILLCDDRRVVVTDFGIAKATRGSDLTATGTWIGTAKYLAPEQVRGERVDPRTDIYALGVVLYECLCGCPPFEGDTDAATAVARLSRDPIRPRQIRPSIPRPLEDLVLRTLARDPDRRPPTAAALRGALLEIDLDDATQAAGDRTVVVAPPPTTPVGAEPSFVRSERRWLVPAALLIVVAGALTLAGLLVGRTDAGREIIDRAREAVGAAPAAPLSPVDPADPPSPPRIADALAFDPQGIGPPGENDDLVPLAIDGDPTTAWRTEGYESRAFSGIKDGVGLVVRLAQPALVSRVVVESPTADWSVTVHLATTTEVEGWAIDDWGPARAGATGIQPGRVALEVEPSEAAAVLVWITDLGAGAAPVRTEISAVIVE